MASTLKKLKGIVVAVERTKEVDEREGEEWSKCVFTLRLTRFANELQAGLLPESLRGKEIKLVRFCLYDWHYKLGTEKTLEPEETAAILASKQTKTVFW